MGIHAGGNTAVVPLFPILFKDDVDDPRAAAGGIIFCGGVGHDLDAFDGVGRDLVEGQRGRPAVDEDGGRCAAEGQVAVDVDVDGGNVAHYIHAGAARA